MGRDAVNVSRAKAKVNGNVTPVMAQAKKSVSIVLVKVVSDVFHVTVGENLAGTTQSARIALVTDTNSAVNAMEEAIMNASRVTVTVMKSATTATERALLTVKRAMVKERWT